MALLQIYENDKTMIRNLPDIQNQLRSQDLFDAFKTQLAKDFQQSNFPIDFVEKLPSDYESLLEKIIAQLQCYEKRTDVTVWQLLYRIDISEHPHESLLKTMAELIIMRVLQKVVIKRMYKQNEAGPDITT